MKSLLLAALAAIVWLMATYPSTFYSAMEWSINHRTFTALIGCVMVGLPLVYARRNRK